MNKIVLASNNIHKIREFTKILKKDDIDLIPQSDLNIPDIPETGLTFVENSICLLYTSPSPRDRTRSRMPSSAWKKK